jgi:hypothetical protein
VFHPEHYSPPNSVLVNLCADGAIFDSLEDENLPPATARCGGCDEPLHSIPFVHRDGKRWHMACFKTFEVNCNFAALGMFSADFSPIKGLHRRFLGHLPRPLSVVSDRNHCIEAAALSVYIQVSPSISLPSLASSPSRSATGGSSTPDYVSFYSVDNPSAGAARLSLEEFCADVYRGTGATGNLNDSVALVATLLWHKETTGVRHEFLLAQVCQLGRNDVWLRLERGARRNGSALRRMQLASSVSCLADDSVSRFQSSVAASVTLAHRECARSRYQASKKH